MAIQKYIGYKLFIINIVLLSTNRRARDEKKIITTNGAYTGNIYDYQCADDSICGYNKTN